MQVATHFFWQHRAAGPFLTRCCVAGAVSLTPRSPATAAVFVATTPCWVCRDAAFRRAAPGPMVIFPGGIGTRPDPRPDRADCVATGTPYSPPGVHRRAGVGGCRLLNGLTATTHWRVQIRSTRWAPDTSPACRRASARAGHHVAGVERIDYDCGWWSFLVGKPPKRAS